MTQNEEIYNHMLHIGPITPWIAIEEYRCLRLPARIKELRKLGIDVKDRWVEHKNREGKTKRFKEYYLE